MASVKTAYDIIRGPAFAREAARRGWRPLQQTLGRAVVAVAVVCTVALASAPDLHGARASAATVGSALEWNRAYDGYAAKVAAWPARLRGYGALAVRQGIDLYIVDGDAPAARAFRRIEHGATVRGTAWSHDGRWLAFATDRRLWLFDRRGSAPRRIPVAVAPGDAFVWSPHADVLAVIAAQPGRRYPCFWRPAVVECAVPPSSPITLVEEVATTSLVTTELRVTRLPITGAPAGLRWSADGRRISSYFFTAIPAYRSFTTSRTAVYREQVSARGRTGREELVAQSAPGGQLAFAAIPQFGDAFVYWMGSELSASASADGQDLVVSAPSGTSRSLGVSLVHREWITFAPDGKHFVFVAGGGREAWHAKTLKLCGARCRGLPAPAGSISVDPTWNPRGARIAFVHAADIGPDGGYGTAFIPSWINRRALWVENTQSGIVQPLKRFGTGIFWPHWSRDGRMLMAFRDGEIWFGSPDGSAPQRIVSGLARPADFDTFMFDHGVSSAADAPVDWTGG